MNSSDALAPPVTSSPTRRWPDGSATSADAAAPSMGAARPSAESGTSAIADSAMIVATTRKRAGERRDRMVTGAPRAGGGAQEPEDAAGAITVQLLSGCGTRAGGCGPPRVHSSANDEPSSRPPQLPDERLVTRRGPAPSPSRRAGG